MNGSARLAAILGTIAVIAVVGVGLGLLPGRSSPAVAVVGPTPASTPAAASAPTATSAPPSQSASPALDTGSWKTYRSARYGFTIGYPPDTAPKSATRNWTLAADAADWQSDASEDSRRTTIPC